jgi:hypothetical protein
MRMHCVHAASTLRVRQTVLQPNRSTHQLIVHSTTIVY